MAREHDTMIDPPIEELLERVDSKFRLVTLAARRARQINAYFNHLGEALGTVVPPQVTSVARKPLSISFEEIAQDKIRPVVGGHRASDEDAAVHTEATATGEVERAEAAEVEVVDLTDGAAG
jgi:DNA-directed RNA polymerase subunit omega